MTMKVNDVHLSKQPSTMDFSGFGMIMELNDVYAGKQLSTTSSI
jgi:hypothetical protein